jgi:hypothetical protein
VSVEEAIAELARHIGRAVAAELRGVDMVSQHGSPLGPRRHRAAVKRRKSLGLPGAQIYGRDYLLSREALAEERAKGGPRTDGPPSGPSVKKARTAELAELARETAAELRTLRRGKS